MEPKTIRCTNCSAEFSDKETEGVTCCPKCGHKGLPMSIEKDVMIKINVHELRILGIWAENYAVIVDNQNLDNPHHESLKESLGKICGRIREQLKALGKDAPLTLSAELKDIQDSGQVKGDIQLFRDGREEII